jgi:hypothetical protein
VQKIDGALNRGRVIRFAVATRVERRFRDIDELISIAALHIASFAGIPSAAKHLPSVLCPLAPVLFTSS